MNNKKFPLFSEGFVGTLAIIGAIVGTIIMVVAGFGEWYAEFDVEPTGLITGILTLALLLLPLVISLFIGGGIGFLACGFFGMFIEFLFNSLVSFFRNKRNQARQRRECAKASKHIRLANKNINEDISALKELRKKLISSDKAIVANYNLCLLINDMTDNKSSIIECLSYCKENYIILTQITMIEQRVKTLANQYKTIGDNKSSDYYQSFIGSEKQ